MAVRRRSSRYPASARTDTTPISRYHPVATNPRLDNPNQAINGATNGAQQAAQAVKAIPAAPAAPILAAVGPRFICVSFMISPFNGTRMLCLHQRYNLK
jgi:hypothetical protein